MCIALHSQNMTLQAILITLKFSQTWHKKSLKNNVNKITQSKSHLLKDNKQNIAENQHVSSKFYVWIKVLFLTLAHSAANPLK